MKIIDTSILQCKMRNYYILREYCFVLSYGAHLSCEKYLPIENNWHLDIYKLKTIFLNVMWFCPLPTFLVTQMVKMFWIGYVCFEFFFLFFRGKKMRVERDQPARTWEEHLGIQLTDKECLNLALTLISDKDVPNNIMHIEWDRFIYVFEFILY